MGNVVLIIQARMGSSRLPGKVLLDLGGRPMLIRQIERLRRCTTVDRVVIATSIAGADDAIEATASAIGVDVFRGSEDDVLQRFVGAARRFDAGVVVRCTGDCPLIDPGVVDRVISDLLAHRDTCDYASNALRRTFPRGLDTEAMYFDTLLRIDRMAVLPAHREHVTILPRADERRIFLCRSVEDAEDNSRHRWTVDTLEDFAWLSRVFRELELADRDVPYGAMLESLRAMPELVRLDTSGETWDPTRLKH